MTIQRLTDSISVVTNRDTGAKVITCALPAGTATIKIDREDIARLCEILGGTVLGRPHLDQGPTPIPCSQLGSAEVPEDWVWVDGHPFPPDVVVVSREEPPTALVSCIACDCAWSIRRFAQPDGSWVSGWGYRPSAEPPREHSHSHEHDHPHGHHPHEGAAVEDPKVESEKDWRAAPMLDLDTPLGELS